MLLRQLSYAIKTQLMATEAPYEGGVFRAFRCVIMNQPLPITDYFRAWKP